MEKSLDEKKIIGIVLPDLSKAFDSILPHHILIAKMYAYRFSINTVTFFYSYLKSWNQNVKINNSHSAFQVFLSGVSQVSIPSPFLFNIFTNDLYLLITKTDLLNFADDNNISAAERTIEDLMSALETESQATIEWFKLREMIVNYDKFQAIVVKKNATTKYSYPLNINDIAINSESSLKLLGIGIDHISCPLSNTFLPSIIKQATN